jgi:hypothetical protein
MSCTPKQEAFDKAKTYFFQSGVKSPNEERPMQTKRDAYPQYRLLHRSSQKSSHNYPIRAAPAYQNAPFRRAKLQLPRFLFSADPSSEKRPLGAGEATSPAYRDDNDERQIREGGPQPIGYQLAGGVRVPLPRSLSNPHRHLL